MQAHAAPASRFPVLLSSLSLLLLPLLLASALLRRR